jgi:type VI secretion system secreted protein VgrG
LTAVFNRYSLQSGTNYQINLRPPIETRKLIMQFEETDFNFMQRWLEYEAAYYYFKQGSEGEEMVIVDDTSNLPTNSISLKYIPEGTISQNQATEGLMHFVATQELTIQSVQLQDYNYRHAQSLVEGSSQNNQALWGTIFSFGGNLLTNEHAKKYAQLRVEAAGTLGMVVRGKTQVTGITAGSLISVSQHPDQSLNTQFRVISVHHAGMQTGFGVGVSKQDETTEETNFYTATFEVIPTSTQFRLPLKTPRPRIYGFLPGIIDGEGDGKTPELDGQGRYKVRFPFACNIYSPGKASPWIRMATPYGGGGERGNSGLSFPLLIGTEVMLIFNNGDPDLPEIAGALANSIAPNTVNNQNPSVNQMISHGGNQLQLDDTNNASGVRFLSNQGSMMYLGAFGGKFGTPGDESNS